MGILETIYVLVFAAATLAGAIYARTDWRDLAPKSHEAADKDGATNHG